MRPSEAAAPPDPHTESFSCILERLTQIADASGIQFGDKPAASGRDAADLANNLKSARRQLTPVPQLRSGREKISRTSSDSESMSLSYESALRAHSRYRPTGESLPETWSVSAPTIPTAALQTKPQTKIPPPTQSPVRVGQTVFARNKATTRSLPQAKQPYAHSPAAFTVEAPESAPRNRTTRTPTSMTEIAAPVDNYADSNALSLEKKQTTMSMRLSLQDADQLRMCAAESGMTVSAYMRSCILEGDHLRSQVKQALAELRARSQDLQQLSLPISTQPRKASAWIRLFTRPVEFFFGPRLPLRRSA
jgi:hypothetical protein